MATPATSLGTGPSPDGLLADLAAAGFVVGPRARTSSTVLDTFDGRLHDAGLRLEHRIQPGGAILVLRGPGSSVATLRSSGVPRFPADVPAGPFRARLATEMDVRAVLPLATVELTTQRAERRNRDGKVVAAVAVVTDVTVGATAVPGWFAAVEPLTGYEHQADDAADVVAPHVGDATDGDVVALALDAAGVACGGQHVDPGIPLDPDLPAVEGFRLVLANLAEAIRVNRPGTVADLDAEFLHDLRVAVRRTRSVLRHGRDVLAPDLLAWAEPAMRSLGDLTSPPRDLDVQVLEWDGRVAALGDPDAVRALEPLHRQLVADRAAAHATLSERLDAADVSQLLARWDELLAEPMDPAAGGPRGADPIGAVVADHIRHAQRRLLRQGRAITDESPGELLHDARKDAKKLRYLLECFAGVLPTDERKAFVKHLKRLQDLLGEHQDAEVQAVTLHTIADELPTTTPAATYVAIGRLVEQLEVTRQETRDRFAERFAEYDAKPTRAALREVLADLPS